MAMDPDEIADLSDSALWAALDQDDSVEKCWVMLEIGSRAYGNGDLAEAITMAEQAATTALTVGDSRLAGGARMSAARAHAHHDDLPAAVASAKDAIERFTHVGDQAAITDAYLWISNYSLQMGAHEDALQSARDALTFATNEEAEALIGWSRYYAGKALYQLDREPEALDELATARGHFREMGQVQNVAMVDDYAATVHTFLGNYDEAVTLLRGCAHVAEATKDSEDDAYSLSRLGRALMRVDLHGDAIEVLERARTAYQARDRLGAVAECDRNIADSLEALGGTEPNWDRERAALDRFAIAQAVFDGLGDDRNARYCTMRRSQILHQMGDYAASERLTRRLFHEVLAELGDTQYGYVYWVGLHQAGNLLRMERYQEVLELTDTLIDAKAETTDKNLAWKHTMRARAHFAMDAADEALAEVEAALAVTNDENLDAETAYLYGIRAQLLLRADNKAGERDLAHAIAIHLAAGEDDEARELARYFMPHLAKSEDAGLGPDVEARSELADGQPGYPIGFVPS